MVRPLPPVENVSLFRVEESEAEQELRAMLGLVTPEDPEAMVSVRSPPQTPSKGPENPADGIEPPSSSRLVLDTTPISNPPTPLSNDMQVDQAKIPPVTTRFPDQTSITDSLPLSNPTLPTIEFRERPSPVSEPPQPPSWNPIGFVGDEEEEEEEEIPSINMESDSD